MSAPQNQDVGKDAYDQVCCYSLTHGDPLFIHQHVVDAYHAQSFAPGDKPIGLAFALVGLYLHVEKGFTGKQVQQAHMKIARTKKKLPNFDIPTNRGDIDAVNVLNAQPGPERDKRIHDWCVSVWNAFSKNRGLVENILLKGKILQQH